MDSDSEDSIELKGPINQQQRLVHQRINFNINNFEGTFRISRNIAENLLRSINHLLKHNTQRNKLYLLSNNLITLRFFATNSFYSCGDVHLEYVPLPRSLWLFTYCTSTVMYSRGSLYAVLVLALLTSATSTSAAYISSSRTRTFMLTSCSSLVLLHLPLPLTLLHPDPDVWVPTTTI